MILRSLTPSWPCRTWIPLKKSSACREAGRSGDKKAMEEVALYERIKGLLERGKRSVTVQK